MNFLSLPIVLLVLVVGASTIVLAAGGGGSAGGSGAQNAIASGRTMADGQLGPKGAPNNPRALSTDKPAGGDTNRPAAVR